MVVAPRRPALVDPDLETRLADVGYVVVPVLGADEVRTLRVAHAAVAEEPTAAAGDAVIDYTRPDRAAMGRVAGLVGSIVWPRLTGAFDRYEPAFATFVVKPADPRSAMFLHEDRTWVDEPGVVTCTAWIPLVDTSPALDNGPLHVVPRSHRIPVGLSGTGTPRWCEHYEPFLRAHAVGLEVRAGEAVIYDSRLLHFSPANRRPGPRPAVVVTAVPTGSDLVHVVATDRRHRSVYAVDRRFFVDVHPADAAAVLAAAYPVRRVYVADREVPTPGDVAVVAVGATSR